MVPDRNRRQESLNRRCRGDDELVRARRQINYRDPFRRKRSKAGNIGRAVWEQRLERDRPSTKRRRDTDAVPAAEKAERRGISAQPGEDNPVGKIGVCHSVPLRKPLRPPE